MWQTKARRSVQEGVYTPQRLPSFKTKRSRKVFKVQKKNTHQTPQCPHRHQHTIHHHGPTASCGGALRRCHTRSVWTSAPRCCSAGECICSEQLDSCGASAESNRPGVGVCCPLAVSIEIASMPKNTEFSSYLRWRLPFS